MTTIPKPSQKTPEKFNTLQILRGGWYATWGVSLLLLIVSIQGVHSQRDAIKTVGDDAAPSVLNSQRLKDAFADMDASLANELLLKPGANAQVLKDFEKNRVKIAERLVLVGKNITYAGEEKLITAIQLNSSAYLLKLQAARDTHKRGEAASTLNIYREAANLMDNDIIQRAEQLSELNSVELDNKYAQHKSENGRISFLIAIVGLAQIAMLVAIQIFLYRRMQRILNLPLLGATVVSVIFLGYTLNSFVGATNNLRIAKEDAFNSLHALRRMRSLSYQANADESRYLLDKQNASQHQKSFDNKISTIINIDPTQSRKSIDSIITTVGRGDRVTGLTGLFADELNNLTFVGERELAIDTLKKFTNYLEIDKQIRQLYSSGKIAEAIALCVGNNPGESNWAFDEYKNAQTRLNALNEKQFYLNIRIGRDRLEYFEIIAATALGSIAILTLLGLRPRLVEYL